MKTRVSSVVLLAASLLWAAGAEAQGSLEVTREVEVNTDAETLWGIVGGFGSAGNWHPLVVDVELTGDGTQPGDRRLTVLGDGATILEELVDLDAEGMSITYTIVESPLPVADYRSTLSVRALGDSTAQMRWSGTFTAHGATDEEASAQIAGIYQVALDALQSLFE